MIYQRLKRSMSRLLPYATMLLVCVGIAFTATRATSAPSPQARVVPLTDIKIDGRLGDWPTEMAAYPIDGMAEEASSMWGGVPDGPSDFSGRFHTGYDAVAQRLYIAVIIEDDEAGLPGSAQDVCAVSMYPGMRTGGDDGASGTRFFLSAEPGATPAAFPHGAGPPGLEGASRRLATTMVYEWALPLSATWGDTIGLLVTVIDGDGRDHGSYVWWGDGDGREPGVLLLAREDEAHRVRVDPWGAGEAGVMLTGMVRSPRGEPLSGVPLVIGRNGRVAATAHSDDAGRFAVELMPHEYIIDMAPGFGVEVGDPTRVNLVQDMHVELQTEPLRVPDELRRAALRYRGLQSYSDTTQLRDVSHRGHVHGRGTRQRTLAYERPHRIRLTASNHRRAQTVMVCDGEYLMAIHEGNGGMEYLRKEMPEALYQALMMTAVSTGAIVDDLVLQLLLSDDAMSVLTRDTVQIRKTGEDQIDGVSTWRFELDKLKRSGLGPRVTDVVGDTTVVQLWVGQQDYMIRQVVIEQDVAADTMSRQEAGTRRRRWHHRAVRIDERAPEGTFVLRVPEDARLVQRFGRPSTSMYRAATD